MGIEEIARVRETHPDNLMARYFDPAYYEALPLSWPIGLM